MTSDAMSEVMRASDNALILDGLLDLAQWRATKADPHFMEFEFGYLKQAVLNRMNDH